jgi:hypothetical protein
MLATAGCDDQQYAPAVADFGAAASGVVQQTKYAYKLVNDTTVQEKVLAYSITAEPIGDPARAFAPFLSDEDMTIRMTMLDGLQAYATALGSLTGKTTKDLDTEATKLAGALSDLAKNDQLQHSLRETKGITPQDTNAAAAALDAIGKFLINQTISKELPTILKTSQPTIEGIATIFIRELGEPPQSTNAGRLRGELGRAYERLIENQAAIADKNVAGSPEKQQSVAKLAALVGAQRDADAALAATQAALKHLVQLHEALLKVQTTPAVFKTTLAALWADAKPVPAK